MADRYSKQRRQQALIRQAFPDSKPPLLKRPLVLDEKRKIMKEEPKPGN